MNRLKTIGFLPGLAFLFNAITGPGIPATPSIFSVHGAGVIPSLFFFFFFAILSGFSVLLIIEAMQAIPGNKHFQGTVEFGTLLNFYFGKYTHILGQIILYGALQTNAIQSIVLTAQTTDNLLITLFQKTCGLTVDGRWICVKEVLSSPSPFQCESMWFTMGLLICIFLVIPLGIINLDDNLMVQMFSFLAAIVIGIQWISAGILKGLVLERVPAFAPFSLNYGYTLGPIILNLAFTYVVPSWINLKRKDVNAQSVVWTSVFFSTGFYSVFGIIAAMAFIDTGFYNSNILQDLQSFGIPSILTKFTVFAYAYVMLLTSIPVNFIISGNNLVQNKVLAPPLAKFCAFILPWFFVIPLQTGYILSKFNSWTSLIFVSTANFIMPIFVYYSCKSFRKSYNQSRGISFLFDFSFV